MASELKTFRDVCCHKLKIPTAAFEEKVLMECLPPRHLFVGKLRWRFDRGYYKPDLEIIRAVANCTSMSELNSELSYYRRHQPASGFARNVLKARLSGQRLVNFASHYLPPN